MSYICTKQKLLIMKNLIVSIFAGVFVASVLLQIDIELFTFNWWTICISSNALIILFYNAINK